MSENENNKSTVTSYRLSEDAKGKVKQQINDMGLTQEAYFNKVVALMELENVKKNSFFSVNTNELQDITQRLYSIFINLCDQGNSFLSNKDVELDELKNKFKDMLSDKENIIQEQKQDLQCVYTNLDVLQKEDLKRTEELEKLKIEHEKQLKQLQDNLQDKNSLVEEYKSKNDDLLDIVAEYKGYKTEVEEYKKLLSDAQTRKFELENSIKEKDLTIKTLSEEMRNAKALHASDLSRLGKEINDLKENHKNEIENLKKALAEKAEFEKEKALLDQDKKNQECINKLNEVHNQKVVELLASNEEQNKKIRELLDQLDKAKK